MRLLILGGTTEASVLVRRIAGRGDLDPVLSFAGRTRSPVPPPIPFRVGGFGGVGG
jgi:precorrin-6A/cobalt-precorrin-6A reductase